MPQGNRAPLHAGLSPLALAADEHAAPRLERFLLLREVEAATGLKRAAIYALMKRGEFPRQVRIISKPGAKRFNSVWIGREIAKWQAPLIAERDRLAEAGLAPTIPARLLPAAKERAAEARRMRARKSLADRDQGRATAPASPQPRAVRAAPESRPWPKTRPPEKE
jgi:predicted DNA-binding transcriptional regulator AlpA